MEKIYRERGLDFRKYKESTLTRRLNRRLRARGAKTYLEYARILDNDKTECDRLFNDLSINVTSFFRDEVAFKALEDMVLPALIGRGNGASPSPLRIWSAGCATGEEAYSVAMLLLERLGEKIDLWDITILGTDIDGRALDQAREGSFTSSDVGGIPPAWRDMYFDHENKTFRAQAALRQLVTFEAHNLAGDPPYHGLDLVVCRNVLIYFNPDLQSRVLEGFYEGLKKGGFLLLGKSEVPVGETRQLFRCVDKKAKLYQKG